MRGVDWPPRRHHDCQAYGQRRHSGSIDAAIEFFTELGLNLEAPIEGDWADGVTGLRDMRVEIAMMARRMVTAGSSCRDSWQAACGRRSQRPSERSRLPTCHVHRGGHRRYARPARQMRAELFVGSGGTVRRRISALLHPRPRRNSHRARPRARAADFPMSYCDSYSIWIGVPLAVASTSGSPMSVG